MADFWQAVKWLKQGKLVGRKSEVTIYGRRTLFYETLMDTRFHFAGVTWADLLADDWEVIDK
jgi:hypothetical protein